MNQEKLNKYRNGNFVLQNKHIYAKNRIKQIIKYISNKYNLTGGAKFTTVDAIKNNINSKTDFYSTEEFGDIQTSIANEMEKIPLLLVNNKDSVFTDLMNADKELVTEFKKFVDINNANFDGLANKEETKKQLLDMQKSLFNLQVKIIFSKLRKIKHVDITPLLKVINNKILKMNNYIEKQEKIYSEDTPIDKSSSVSNNTSSTVQKPDESSNTSTGLSSNTTTGVSNTSNVQPNENTSNNSQQTFTKDEVVDWWNSYKQNVLKINDKELIKKAEDIIDENNDLDFMAKFGDKYKTVKEDLKVNGMPTFAKLATIIRKLYA
jgi:hypothetical protein